MRRVAIDSVGKLTRCHDMLRGPGVALSRPA